MGLGLPTALVGAIYGLLSVGLAWVLLRGFPETAIRNNLLIFAACTSVFFHIIPSHALLFFVFTVVLYFARPKQPEHVPALYFGYLLLFPFHISYQIPFPGLNFLIIYSWWLPLALVFLSHAPRRRDMEWNSVDVFFTLYILLVVVLDFRENTITNGVREAFMTISYLFVPYWFLRRAFRSHDDLAVFIRGVFVTAVILGCFAFISQLRQWDFMGGAGMPEYRFGLLRLGITLSTGLMGFVCGIGLLLLLYRRRELGLSPLWASVIAFILTLAILASGARVAIFSTVLLGLTLAFYSSITPRRLIAGTFVVIVAYGFIIERLVTLDMSAIDEFGTFSYRQQILAATLETIGDSLIWGNIHFQQSPYLQPLDQNQDFTDIVNRYAEIALQYGLIVLIFFVLAQGLAIFKVVQDWAAPTGSDRGARLAPPDLKFVVACSLVYMFFIGTTSHTSHVALFGVILLAILRSCMSIEQQDERERPKNFAKSRRGLSPT